MALSRAFLPLFLLTFLLFIIWEHNICGLYSVSTVEYNKCRNTAYKRTVLQRLLWQSITHKEFSFSQAPKTSIQKVSQDHNSQNPAEVLSNCTLCIIFTCSPNFQTLDETLPLWSMYMQQLVLIIVRIPPCEVNKLSNTILFCSVILKSCETSYCNAEIVSAVLLPRISIATEMLTQAFLIHSHTTRE